MLLDYVARNSQEAWLEAVYAWYIGISKDLFWDL
jgi:hypothetical protein